MQAINDKHLMEDVMSIAWQVRREYGPGLPESAYEYAMMSELQKRGIRAERKEIDKRVSVLVENCLLLGLRCVDSVTSMHGSQIKTYLRKLRFKQGLLLNFNSTFIRQGAYAISL